MGIAPSALPQALPAPWPGQICKWSGSRRGALQGAEELRAPASIVPDRLRRLLQQVGATDIADEDEVAGDHRHRFLAPGRVGHDEGEVLGRVSGGVPHLEPHATHA